MTKDSKRREILKDMNASDVPKEFIDVIKVYLTDGEIIPFEVTNLVDTFSLDDLRDFLQQRKINDRVDLVEIYLDLDLVFNLEVKSQSQEKKTFPKLTKIVDKYSNLLYYMY